MSFDYQNKLIAQILANRRMVVARYGAGKCRVALLAADTLCPPSGLILVICPPKNLRTWMVQSREWLSGAPGLEIDLHAPEVHPAERVRTGQKKLLIVKHSISPAQWLYLADLQPQVIIYDESTAIKNHQTRQAANAHLLAKRTPEAFRMCLTGDPTPEHPIEIWSQFEFCYHPHNPFGNTYYKFTRQWFIRTDFTWALRMDLTSDFVQTFDKCSCRMDEDDVAEHKALVDTQEEYQTVLYQASDTQKKLMAELTNTWSLPAGTDLATDGTEEYWHTISILHRSLQIASGFYYTHAKPELEEGRMVRFHENPKAEKLLEICKILSAHGHKRIIVWCYYKADVHACTITLASWFQVSPPNQYGLDQFSQEPGYHDKTLVTVLPLSLARGINELKTASVDIFFSNTFKQEIRNQAEARLPRPGNPNKKVIHIDLACEELVDSRVVFALQTKQMSEERAKTIVTDMLLRPELSK